VGAASNSFSVALANDRTPHHFRVRCEWGVPFYSVNAATYYYVQPPSGFSMLSYPLETISNTLSNLLPTVSEGTLLHWFDVGAQRLETAQFQFGRWSHPGVQIQRGRAVLLWSPPQAKPIVLHGTIAGGNQTNHLANGYNLLSPAWPTGSPIPEHPLCFDRFALVLIGTDGIDPIYSDPYEGMPDWFPDPPPFPAFDGLWLFNPCSAYTWVQGRTFPAMDAPGANQTRAEGAATSGSQPAAVYLNNYVPGFRIDARIVHTNGETPAGTNWLARLYGGAPGDAENDLVASVNGVTLPFLSGPEAGYLDTTGGATAILSNGADSGDSVAQIRFWDARTGATYESATVRGRTPMFLVPTRFDTVRPAAPMLGLMSPRLSISRSLLPAAAHLSVQGYAGMSYSIEASSTLSNWTTVATVTNTTSISTFVEPGANTNQQRFYRAKIFGPAM
jgi:hypothetical protein